MPSLLTATASRFTSRAAPLLVPLYDQRFGPWQIAGDGSFVCGAAPDADLSIRQSSLQPQHLRLDFRQGCLTLVRLDGRVWVNEVPVMGDTVLEPDDVICLGSLTIRVLAADPLRPVISEADGVVRRPLLLGAANPTVYFTAGSDRRFHQVFPRVNEGSQTAAPQHSERAAVSNRGPDDTSIRQLLEREADAARREKQLQVEEQRLAELLAELEQARTELQQEQQAWAEQSTDRRQFQQDRDAIAARLAEAHAIRTDAEAMHSHLLRTRQELTQLAEQLEQQRTQLTQAAAQQQTALADARSLLASQQQELEQQRTQLTQETAQQQTALADARSLLASQQQELEQQRTQLTQETAQQQTALDDARSLLASQQRELEQQHLVAVQSIRAAEQQLSAIETQRSDLVRQQQLLLEATAAVAQSQQQLDSHQQALQAQAATLDERARRIQQASLNRSTVDSQQLLLQSQVETRSAELEVAEKQLAARSAELAERETELATRVAVVCKLRRRHATQLNEERKQLDAISLELRQQKSALRLRARELETIELSLNQRTSAISADRTEQQNRVAELQLELEAARSRQELVSQQLSAALMTCEQLRSSRETLLSAQGTIRQRDLQLLEMQQLLNSATASVAERDDLIQALHQQLLNLLAERRTESQSEPAESTESLGTQEIWRHPEEVAHVFAPPTADTAVHDTAELHSSTIEPSPTPAETPVAQVPDQPHTPPEMPQDYTAAPIGNSLIPAHDSLLKSLTDVGLHLELVRLLKLSQPESTQTTSGDNSLVNSEESVNFLSGGTVPLLDEATARMLEESEPEVRSHIEKLLQDQRRTEDEARDMPAQKPTTTVRRSPVRPPGRPEPDERGAKNRTPTSYIDLYNDGKLSLTSDQPALEVAAEAADRMSLKNASENDNAHPADAPAVPYRMADELVRYHRSRNTNDTINQTLHEMRKLSADASQTAIIRHSLRRHRKGFLVRIAATVAGMLAVVLGPPWIWLWTKNQTLAIWGPRAFFALTCLELTRKLIIVLLLERKKPVEPVARQQSPIPRPAIPVATMESEPEIDDQHPLI